MNPRKSKPLFFAEQYEKNNIQIRLLIYYKV